MFGESWDEAVASGKVFNAKDAAAKLGVDGFGLEQKVNATQMDRGALVRSSTPTTLIASVPPCSGES